jgi:pre-mRNA-processing factor 6
VLWILASRFEETNSSAIKARATLEKARVLNQTEPDVWLESINVETRAGNTAMAKALLAKSLQTCPTSGKLWSQAIIMENRPQRKARSADALKKCENDAIVVMTIARLFWAERKIDKARNWFERASKTDPDVGDVWAWWLAFEKLHGTPAQRQVVVDGCVQAEPKHGEEWQKISKDLSNVGKSAKQVLDIVAANLENNL